MTKYQGCKCHVPVWIEQIRRFINEFFRTAVWIFQCLHDTCQATPGPMVKRVGLYYINVLKTCTQKREFDVFKDQKSLDRND